MELTNKQEAGLAEVLRKYRNHDKYAVISGYAGSGKAQPIDTIIPTPLGNKKLGDIKVGDFVFDRQGEPTKVLGVYPQGVIDNYKITLEDGRTTYCNGEHIWTYYTSKGNLNNKTTLEMIESGLKYSGRGCYKFKIPNITKPVVFHISETLDIDPYVIGCFLGDGCCKERQLTISSADEELVSEISKLIKAENYCKNSDTNYNWTFLLPKEKRTYYNNIENTKFITDNFFNSYQSELCCGAEEKRVPFKYKYASIEDRYSLIQGLMDTDGSINSNDNHRYNIRYTSINLTLIKDIQDILYSLGYKSTITTDNREEKYTNKICYSLNINIPNEEKYKIFRLSRKKNIALEAKKYPKRKDYSKIAIVSIEKMPEQKEMVCIYVDNNEHLYLTNDYIVTHNTTLVKFIIEALDIEQDKVAYATFTGKAAEVLRKKGNPNAMTLCKLLYESIPKRGGGFFRIPRNQLEYTVIVVDEVSMVPKTMIDMLLKHKVFCIFLGDPCQLPQIDKKESHTLLDKPDIFLDEIMRQAQESEIIRLTMDIREGKSISYQKGNEVMVIPKSELVTGHLTWADQIICATNRTRIDLNNQMRQLLGYKGLPQTGDRMICLRNYWDDISDSGSASLVNGTTGIIQNPFETWIEAPRYIKMKNHKMPVIQGSFIADDGETYSAVDMDKYMIETGEPFLDWRESYALGRLKMKIGDIIPRQFTYGYAITGWKAQGSEWDKVLAIEENFPFDKEEHIKFLYTIATRASKKLVLLKNTQ